MDLAWSALPDAAAVSDSAAMALDEEGLYSRMKHLHRQLEFADIQEEYMKDEQKNPMREQEEVKCIQSVPLVIGQFSKMVDQGNAMVGSTTGSNYHFRILSIINKDLLEPSSSASLHRRSNALVELRRLIQQCSLDSIQEARCHICGRLQVVFHPCCDSESGLNQVWKFWDSYESHLRRMGNAVLRIKLVDVTPKSEKFGRQ